MQQCVRWMGDSLNIECECVVGGREIGGTGSNSTTIWTGKGVFESNCGRT